MLDRVKLSKYLGRNDYLLLLFLAVLPCIMLIANAATVRRSSSAAAAVYVEGKLYGKYDLSEPETIQIGDTNTLSIQDGCAQMIKADCRDQVCVHSAPLKEDSPGAIVCLPNKIVVVIEDGDNPDEIDGYVT